MGKMNNNITVKQFLSGLASAIILMLISNYIIFGREDNKDLQKKVDEKADITYVDKQDQQLRAEIKTTVANQEIIINMISDMRKENQENFKEIRNQLYKK